MEEEDISQERSHREGGWRKEKEPQEKERGPWDARGVGDSSPRAKVSFSLRPLGRPILYVSPPPLRTSRRLIRAQLPYPLSTNSL